MRARGHDVRVISNPHFREDILSSGLEFVGISTVEEYDRLTRNPDMWRPLRGLGLVLRDGAVAFRHELYDRIVENHDPGRTVIGAHGLDLASRVAAEALGVPVSSVVYAPMALWSDRSPPRLPISLPGPIWLSRVQYRLSEWLLSKRLVGRAVDELRERVGLPAIDRPYFDWYYGVAPPLCLFPEWFAPNPGDWPQETELTGFPLWDRGGNQKLPDEILRFLDAGEAPIVFTPGSANRFGDSFFATAVSACERLGRRGVLLTKYEDHLPRRLPDAVRHCGFVPLSHLLPRAAAFAHHDGVGSCAQGLAAGVPQLIRPQGFDQFDNAMRLRRLGVAEEISPRRFATGEVATALDRLLSNKTVAQRCEVHAGRCREDAGVAAACESLEKRFAMAQ